MIYNYPFSSSSSFRRFPSRRYSPAYYPMANPNNRASSFDRNSKNEQRNANAHRNITDNSHPKENLKQKENTPNEVFEIFGIKLFFDDILLICLIFFLYNEGVKDQSLFIILILLLIT